MSENNRFNVDVFIQDNDCGFQDLEGNVCEIEDNGKPMTYKEVCDLLNKLYDENKSLRIELDTHKHPLWSTREAERILKEKEGEIIELIDLLANEVYKNGNLLSEINNLRKKLMICEKIRKGDIE